MAIVGGKGKASSPRAITVTLERVRHLKDVAGENARAVFTEDTSPDFICKVKDILGYDAVILIDVQ